MLFNPIPLLCFHNCALGWQKYSERMSNLHKITKNLTEKIVCINRNKLKINRCISCKSTLHRAPVLAKTFLANGFRI